ncbi:hypothetical protein pb186bvf_010326 [Paramecium bursaria]
MIKIKQFFCKIIIPKEKLQCNFTKSSGPGGQHVNKTNSKAEIRFNLNSADWLNDHQRKKFIEKFPNYVNKMGEVILTSQYSRCQDQNLRNAIEKLSDMVSEASRPDKKPIIIPPQTDYQIKQRVESKRRKSDTKKKRQDKQKQDIEKYKQINSDMSEKLEEFNSSAFEPIQKKLQHFQEVTAEEAAEDQIHQCSKFRDADKFADCMSQRSKKVSNVFRIFEYKTLYLSQQLETCLKTNDEKTCVNEALGSLDSYIDQATKALK